jgi:hypothetical protein
METEAVNPTVFDSEARTFSGIIFQLEAFTESRNITYGNIFDHLNIFYGSTGLV